MLLQYPQDSPQPPHPLLLQAVGPPMRCRKPMKVPARAQVLRSLPDATARAEQTEDTVATDIDVFAAGVAACPKLTHLSCSSCRLGAEHLGIICAAACVSATLRYLGQRAQRCISPSPSISNTQLQMCQVTVL